MAKRATAIAQVQAVDAGTYNNPPTPPKRSATGQWLKGSSGYAGSDAARARRYLNASTIMAMQEAFNRGGKAAIDKVMKQQPALFLKMLVLLVPRELEVTHSQGVKGLSDEQIASAIEAIETMLATRVGDAAKVVEGVVADTPSASEP